MIKPGGKAILTAGPLDQCPVLVLVFLWPLDELACCREDSLGNGQSNEFVTGAKINTVTTDHSKPKFCPW